MEHFKKGTMVKIIEPNNHFFDEIGKVLLFDEYDKKYLVQFNNGYKLEIYYFQVVKVLNKKETDKLYREHLLQMADMALAMNDKVWFQKISKQIQQLSGAKREV